MKRYAFRILNVFVREGRLTGNPLCVFEDGAGLDDAAMQALARQFNLSETTFVLPSEAATARVRIFTPSYEMPFAGHPTLGTAHVVRDLASSGDSLTLEMKAGIIPVSARGDRWTLQANPPRSRPEKLSGDELAQILGTGPRRYRIHADAREHRARAAPRAREERRCGSPRRVHAPTCSTASRATKAPGRRTSSRIPATRSSRASSSPTATAILEDPATGSACANLGGWFVATKPGVDVERTVSQGEMVSRPSTLYLSVKAGVDSRERQRDRARARHARALE